MQYVSDGFLTFGKHKGESVVKVAEEDSHYLIWMLEELELDNYEADEIEKALYV